MKVYNHHGLMCFLKIVKTQEEIKKDIAELLKFGWSISMIYDNNGYASHACNDEYLTLEALSDEFSTFYLVTLDNKYLEMSGKAKSGRTAIQFTTIEGI